jgi:hypothetical protein
MKALFLVLIGFAIGFLGYVYYRHVTMKEPTPVFKAFNQEPAHQGGVQIPGQEPLKGIVGVDSQGNQTITWKVGGEEEGRLIDIMKREVNGIDDQQAKRLILARLKYNWKDVPELARGDDIEGMYAFQLKHEISEITTNIAEALTAPIGDVRYPPRMDLTIRGSYQEEIEAIKK